MALRALLASALVFLAALPARAALILEYIQVNSLTASLSGAPALTSLTMTPGSTVFLQVALRDTLGSGPNAGQPGTVAWQTNGGFGGPGSVGLYSFYFQFQGVPGVVPTPPSSGSANVRFVDPISYGQATVCNSQPIIYCVAGLLNFGYEPGAVPDPAVLNRIGLFNLRLVAAAAGSGTLRLRDPDPGLNSSVLLDADPGGVPNPGTIVSIDDLLFGPNSINTIDLPVVVTPEPSSMALAGLAAVGMWRVSRGGRRK